MAHGSAVELLETFIYLQEDPSLEALLIKQCAASATCSMHQVIKVPVCQQKPNRHENPTVSTKDQRQTKPLVVSKRAAEAQAGPTALGSALISIYRLPPALSAIGRNITL